MIEVIEKSERRVDDARTVRTPQQAIATSPGERVTVSEDLHGFGGLHGGISVAMSVATVVETSRQAETASPIAVRSVHATYRRAVRGDAVTSIPEWRRGRTVHAATASVESRDRTAVTVSATLAPSAHRSEPFAPPRLLRPRPEECDEFALPVEFVPFGRFVEIRPTVDARPFAGGPSPTLEAWIRMRDDDAPIDLGRLIVLLDSLAPSAAATMTDFVAIPTIEFTVRPRPALADTTSPWMLLHATSEVSGDGWVDERLTAWTLDGQHLASASQLRMVTAL